MSKIENSAREYGWISEKTGKPLPRSFSRYVLEHKDEFPPRVVRQAHRFRQTLTPPPPAPPMSDRSLFLHALGLKAIDLYTRYGLTPNPESAYENAKLTASLLKEK